MSAAHPWHDAPAATVDWPGLLADLATYGVPAAEARGAWLGALRDAVGNGADALAGAHAEPWRHALRAIAALGDDLPLVAWLGNALIDAGEATLDEAVDTALALWRMGRSDDAWALCRRLLWLHPRHARIADLHAGLLGWRRHAHPLAWPAEGWGDDELWLEPLGDHHADDFAWAYQDPEIAARCCLPTFPDAAAWHTWLAREESHADQMTFGVWHRLWGFVGSVNLVMAGTVGFFYYWIAAPFQGQRLGPRAAAALFTLAERDWGMRCCYAKCFVDNLPSRKGLDRLGFVPLDLDVHTERGNELFFHRVSPGRDASADLPGELRGLLEHLGSTSRVRELILPRRVSRPARRVHADAPPTTPRSREVGRHVR